MTKTKIVFLTKKYRENNYRKVKKKRKKKEVTQFQDDFKRINKEREGERNKCRNR